MVDLREFMALVRRHVGRTLTFAEIMLPLEQFQAFRKLVLDEFGKGGLERELMERSRKR
jgi:hypothetical protein